MTNTRWTEGHVRGKLDIYCAQIGRSSPGARQETLRELAGDLIDAYEPTYPGIGKHRTELRPSRFELFGADLSDVRPWDVPVGMAYLFAAAAYAPSNRN